MSDAPFVQLEGAGEGFCEGEARVEALHDASFALRAGELVGPSGSGKSTLLKLIGLLDRVSSGTLRIRGQDVSQLDDAALTRLRGETLGSVFQFHHLLPGLSVVENVILPAACAWVGCVPAYGHAPSRCWPMSASTAKPTARHARSRGACSSGSRSRALMNQPPLVFADEPTGNLDTDSSDRVIDLLRDWNTRLGTTFLIVTHDLSIACCGRRVRRMVDGRLVADGAPEAVLGP